MSSCSCVSGIRQNLRKRARRFLGLPERGLDANRGQSTSSEMGGQIGVQKLRIGAANPNAIMPMVKRLKDRLSRCRIFPHHRTARGIFAPADQFRNRRGRICPPANGPVVRNRLPPAFAGRCRRGVRSPLGRSRKLHYGRVERTANNFAESGSTTRQAFETAAHCADIDFRTEMEINNCEAIREAVVLGLGISVGAETEFGSDRGIR